MTTGRINQVTTFTRQSPKRLYLLKHDATGNHSTSGNFQCTRSLRFNIIRWRAEPWSMPGIKLISTTRFAQSMVLLRLSHSRAQVQYNIVKEMSLRERDKLQRTISPLAPLIAQPTFVNQYTHSASCWQPVMKTACLQPTLDNWAASLLKLRNFPTVTTAVVNDPRAVRAKMLLSSTTILYQCAKKQYARKKLDFYLPTEL